MPLKNINSKLKIVAIHKNKSISLNKSQLSNTKLEMKIMIFLKKNKSRNDITENL